jgi:hypothetical protein
MLKLSLLAATSALVLLVVNPALAQDGGESGFKDDCRRDGLKIVERSKDRDVVRDSDDSTDRCIFLGRGNDLFADEFRLNDGETNETSDREGVFGGPGRDRIDLRDGDDLDFAACGPGEDTVYIDPDEMLLDETCENVIGPTE